MLCTHLPASSVSSLGRIGIPLAQADQDVGESLLLGSGQEGDQMAALLIHANRAGVVEKRRLAERRFHSRRQFVRCQAVR